MSQISIGKHINATREEVFKVLADLHNAPENIRGIEELEILTDGPVGEGTRFRETRTKFGKQATEELVITSFDPPQSYVVECESSGAHYRTEFLLIPDIAGTHLRIICDATPQTLLARLLLPIVNLTSDITSKCIESVLDDVKRIAEASAAPVVHA